MNFHSAQDFCSEDRLAAVRVVARWLLALRCCKRSSWRSSDWSWITRTNVQTGIGSGESPARPSVVVVIWVIVTLDYGHPVTRQTPFTTDSYQDVY